MEELGWWANWANIIVVPLAIISAIVAAISIWLFLRDRQKRALSCEIDRAQFPVEIKAGEALEGEIEIHYKGRSVENLFLVEAKLANTGTLAIRDSHVVEPVTFTFDPDSEILRKPRILHKKQPNLYVDWVPAPEPNVISLEFNLLNPKDEFVTEFLCTGKNAVPEITARIEGVEQIKLLTPGQKQTKALRNAAIAFIMLIILLAIPIVFGREILRILPFPAWIFLMTSLGLIALYYFWKV